MKKRVKKRILSLLLMICLSAALLVAAPGSSAQAAGVTFFAVDESLLDLSYGAIYYGGELYVSPGVFGHVSGLYTSYSASQKMVTMYDANSTLVFDLNLGASYTVGGSQHEAAAVTSGGGVYVPLNYVCTYFGLTYSYIQTDIAPMIRLKTGNEILRDATFISAVSATMSARYDQYVADNPEIFASPVTLCICVTGSLDENTSALLDRLKSSGIKVTFFTDAESITAYPQEILRIYSEGHSIGALADDLDSAQEFNSALDNLLMTRSRLCIAPDELSREGYAVISPNVDASGIGQRTTVSRVVSSISKYSGSYAIVRLDMNENTWSYISQISSGVGSSRSWKALDETFAS